MSRISLKRNGRWLSELKYICTHFFIGIDKRGHSIFTGLFPDIFTLIYDVDNILAKFEVFFKTMQIDIHHSNWPSLPIAYFLSDNFLVNH